MSQSVQDQIHAPQEQKHVTRVTIAIDLVVVAALFVFWFGVCKNHVPSTDPKFVNLFGALTAISITGVFWIAIQMFRVVVAGEKRIKANRGAK
jgi:hypothetical protein